MKKNILLLALFSLIFLTGFEPENLIRLTIINKADIDISIYLKSMVDKDRWYYLTIPEGTHTDPTTKEFTITPDIYDMVVYYVETYDPVYGFPKCGGLFQKGRMDATRNLRVVFTECFRQPPSRGEPTMMKFWWWKPYKFKYIYIY